MDVDSTVAIQPGTRLRTWPTQPLAWVSLSVASDNGYRALVNSIAGTTMLVDYSTGSILGTKQIGEKQSGPGTTDGYAEPAWSVSLSSTGTTYASTGGSGSVTIHSAHPSDSAAKDGMEQDAFGTRLADIPTGRVKFGLLVDHCPTDDNRIAVSSETGQVSTTRTEDIN